MAHLTAEARTTANAELGSAVHNPNSIQLDSPRPDADHDALAELSVSLPTTDLILLADFIANLKSLPTSQELSPIDVECLDDPKTWHEALQLSDCE